jgi:hypothetical protein
MLHFIKGGESSQGRNSERFRTAHALHFAGSGGYDRHLAGVFHLRGKQQSGFEGIELYEV